PRTGVEQDLLELRADFGTAATAAAPGTTGAALIAESSHEIEIVRIGRVQIAEAEDVDAVGTPSLVVAIEQAGDVPASADPEVVVHQVVPECPAVASECVGMIAGLRVEQQARPAEGRGAEE